MSQICRYYVKGICKYGSRCHFLHEDIDRGYKENYSSYSSTDHFNRYHYSKVQNVAKDYDSGYPYNRNYSSNYGEGASNFNRYHVDNRHCAQNETISISDLSDQEILEVIKKELREFEERHVWILTVIAPLKELGNIPGLKDFSPEEIRYQHYESSRTNSLPVFFQNFDMARDNVIKICQLLKTKSHESYEIVKKMTERIRCQSNDEMATDYPSSAAASFTFDLRSIPTSSSSAPVTELPVSQLPEDVHSNVRGFLPGDFSDSHSNHVFHAQSGTTINNFIHQPNSALTSFSFNLKTLQPIQNNSASVFTHPNPILRPSNYVDSTSGNAALFSDNINSVASRSKFEMTNGAMNSCFDEFSSNVTSNFGRRTSASTATNNSVYSEPHEISAEALAAFQAKAFKFGQIPLIPPSKELCFN